MAEANSLPDCDDWCAKESYCCFGQCLWHNDNSVVVFIVAIVVVFVIVEMGYKMGVRPRCY